MPLTVADRTSCLYSVTADRRFLVGELPGSPDVSTWVRSGQDLVHALAFIWEAGQSWTQFALAPRLEVAPGYHVMSDRPSAQTYVPTRVAIEGARPPVEHALARGDRQQIGALQHRLEDVRRGD